jgi:hypothetical protein
MVPQAKDAPSNPPKSAALKAAIAEGRVLIDEGKPKIEAAMRIYGLLESEPQETVVAAFIEGAALTPKGALTYWYNCRRKTAKAKLLNKI